MPVNEYAPQLNFTTGGTFLLWPSGIGCRSFAISLVVMRTSAPVPVVSKTRSMVSLAVVWLTYCFFLAPRPSSLRVFETVCCRLAGLKCTLTCTLGPVIVSKVAGASASCAGNSGMAGLS
ncbi:MAG: hypothetical protein AW11_02173 [Candidatus Accumulibacter regalis]|uniref:Uncharacterized protein n=1 Tax=Accumulibacter regalis TaxID=522306 RepID=A0A011QG21_ACCRE|nr:MAG: hypothetical protein AW11_02173 [Candidatus Accumulibacter regalis]